jgi:carbamoyltransferase
VDDARVREQVVATLHVDGTARVQTVTRKQNAEFHTLLSAFHKLTGVPVLLNTSFNVKGQPIINTPEQAIACFLSTNISMLVIGKFLCVKNISQGTFFLFPSITYNIKIRFC